MTLYVGDCLEVMRDLGSDTVDLIMTSPPYAMARKHTYGGVPAAEYPAWFADRAMEMRRVLKGSGSIIVNIKEGTENGERQTYVMETIMEVRRRCGLKWIEEYVWNKTNAMPGKWPSRFRDAWERCVHFGISDRPAMYQDAVKVPVRKSTSDRYGKISEGEKGRRFRATGSRFNTDWGKFEGRKTAYPSNVITGGLVCTNKGHSAAYPDYLPEFFIRLFTKEGDTVLDPFVGSGTTYRAAKRLHRQAVGIDTGGEYIEAIRRAGRPNGQEKIL